MTAATAASREHALTDDEFSPIVARTSTAHREISPRAFDCAQLAVVRSGSAILFGEFGHRYLNLGDAVLIPPFTLFGVEPEPWVTLTTLHVDNDYLIDQLFWQSAAAFTDRLDTQKFLDSPPADPARGPCSRDPAWRGESRVADALAG